MTSRRRSKRNQDEDSMADSVTGEDKGGGSSAGTQPVEESQEERGRGKRKIIPKSPEFPPAKVRRISTTPVSPARLSKVSEALSISTLAARGQGRGRAGRRGSTDSNASSVASSAASSRTVSTRRSRRSSTSSDASVTTPKHSHAKGAIKAPVGQSPKSLKQPAAKTSGKRSTKAPTKQAQTKASSKQAQATGKTSTRATGKQTQAKTAKQTKLSVKQMQTKSSTKEIRTKTTAAQSKPAKTASRQAPAKSKTKQSTAKQASAKQTSTNQASKAETPSRKRKRGAVRIDTPAPYTASEDSSPATGDGSTRRSRKRMKKVLDEDFEESPELSSTALRGHWPKAAVVNEDTSAESEVPRENGDSETGNTSEEEQLVGKVTEEDVDQQTESDVERDSIESVTKEEESASSYTENKSVSKEIEEIEPAKEIEEAESSEEIEEVDGSECSVVREVICSIGESETVGEIAERICGSEVVEEKEKVENVLEENETEENVIRESEIVESVIEGSNIDCVKAESRSTGEESEEEKTEGTVSEDSELLDKEGTEEEVQEEMSEDSDNTSSSAQKTKVDCTSVSESKPRTALIGESEVPISVMEDGATHEVGSSSSAFSEDIGDSETVMEDMLGSDEAKSGARCMVGSKVDDEGGSSDEAVVRDAVEIDEGGSKEGSRGIVDKDFIVSDVEDEDYTASSSEMKDGVVSDIEKIDSAIDVIVDREDGDNVIEVEKDSVKEMEKDGVQEVENEDTKELQDNDVKELQDDDVKELQDDDVKELQDDDVKELQDDDVKELQDDDVKELQDDDVKEVQDDDVKEVQDDDVKELQDSDGMKEVENDDDDKEVENDDGEKEMENDDEKEMENDEEDEKEMENNDEDEKEVENDDEDEKEVENDDEDVKKVENEDEKEVKNGDGIYKMEKNNVNEVEKDAITEVDEDDILMGMEKDVAHKEEENYGVKEQKDDVKELEKDDDENELEKSNDLKEAEKDDVKESEKDDDENELEKSNDLKEAEKDDVKESEKDVVKEIEKDDSSKTKKDDVKKVERNDDMSMDYVVCDVSNKDATSDFRDTCGAGNSSRNKTIVMEDIKDEDSTGTLLESEDDMKDDFRNSDAIGSDTDADTSHKGTVAKVTGDEDGGSHDGIAFSLENRDRSGNRHVLTVEDSQDSVSNGKLMVEEEDHETEEEEAKGELGLEETEVSTSGKARQAEGKGGITAIETEDIKVEETRVVTNTEAEETTLSDTETEKTQTEEATIVGTEAEEKAEERTMADTGHSEEEKEVKECGEEPHDSGSDEEMTEVVEELEDETEEVARVKEETVGLIEESEDAVSEEEAEREDALADTQTEHSEVEESMIKAEETLIEAEPLTEAEESLTKVEGASSELKETQCGVQEASSEAKETATETEETTAKEEEAITESEEIMTDVGKTVTQAEEPTVVGAGQTEKDEKEGDVEENNELQESENYEEMKVEQELSGNIEEAGLSEESEDAAGGGVMQDDGEDDIADTDIKPAEAEEISISEVGLIEKEKKQQDHAVEVEEIIATRREEEVTSEEAEQTEEQDAVSSEEAGLTEKMDVRVSETDETKVIDEMEEQDSVLDEMSGERQDRIVDLKEIEEEQEEEDVEACGHKDDEDFSLDEAAVEPTEPEPLVYGDVDTKEVLCEKPCSSKVECALAEETSGTGEKPKQTELWEEMEGDAELDEELGLNDDDMIGEDLTQAEEDALLFDGKQSEKDDNVSGDQTKVTGEVSMESVVMCGQGTDKESSVVCRKAEQTETDQHVNGDMDTKEGSGEMTTTKSMEPEQPKETTGRTENLEHTEEEEMEGDDTFSVRGTEGDDTALGEISAKIEKVDSLVSGADQNKVVEKVEKEGVDTYGIDGGRAFKVAEELDVKAFLSPEKTEQPKGDQNLIGSLTTKEQLSEKALSENGDVKKGEKLKKAFKGKEIQDSSIGSSGIQGCAEEKSKQEVEIKGNVKIDQSGCDVTQATECDHKEILTEMKKSNELGDGVKEVSSTQDEGDNDDEMEVDVKEGCEVQGAEKESLIIENDRKDSVDKKEGKKEGTETQCREEKLQDDMNESTTVQDGKEESRKVGDGKKDTGGEKANENTEMQGREEEIIKVQEEKETCKIEVRDNETSKMQDKEKETSKMQDKEKETSKMQDKEKETSKMQDKEKETSKMQDKEKETSKMQDKEKETSKMQDKEKETSKLEDVGKEAHKIQDEQEEASNREDGETDTGNMQEGKEGRNEAQGKKEPSKMQEEEEETKKVLVGETSQVPVRVKETCKMQGEKEICEVELEEKEIEMGVEKKEARKMQIEEKETDKTQIGEKETNEVLLRENDYSILKDGGKEEVAEDVRKVSEESHDQEKECSKMQDEKEIIKVHSEFKGNAEMQDRGEEDVHIQGKENVEEQNRREEITKMENIENESMELENEGDESCEMLGEDNHGAQDGRQKGAEVQADKEEDVEMVNEVHKSTEVQDGKESTGLQDGRNGGFKKQTETRENGVELHPECKEIMRSEEREEKTIRVPTGTMGDAENQTPLKRSTEMLIEVKKMTEKMQSQAQDKIILSKALESSEEMREKMRRTSTDEKDTQEQDFKLKFEGKEDKEMRNKGAEKSEVEDQKQIIDSSKSQGDAYGSETREETHVIRAGSGVDLENGDNQSVGKSHSRKGGDESIRKKGQGQEHKKMAQEVKEESPTLEKAQDGKVETNENGERTSSKRRLSNETPDDDYPVSVAKKQRVDEVEKETVTERTNEKLPVLSEAKTVPEIGEIKLLNTAQAPLKGEGQIASDDLHKSRAYAEEMKQQCNREVEEGEGKASTSVNKSVVRGCSALERLRRNRMELEEMLKRKRTEMEEDQEVSLHGISLNREQRAEVKQLLEDKGIGEDVSDHEVLQCLLDHVMANHLLTSMNTPRLHKFLRQILDKLNSLPDVEDSKKHNLCLKAVEWAREHKNMNLRHELEVTLMTLYFNTGHLKEAEEAATTLFNETKKLQDKEKTVKACLVLSRAYHAMGNVSKARSNLTTAKTEAIKIYTPPDLQAQLDLQSGILQVAEGKDMETAFSYFKEASTSFTSKTKRSQALKYMVLAKVLLGRPEEGEKAVKIPAHLDDLDIGVEAMLAVAQAARKSSLQDFREARKQYRENLEGDHVVAGVLEELYTTMMEHNLKSIIKPYKRMQIPFVAECIGLPREEVERRLSQMILDKRVQAQLDHRDDCLYIYDQGDEDKTYNNSLEVISTLEKTLNLLSQRVKKLL